MGGPQGRRILALALFLLLAAAIVGPDLRRVFGNPLGLNGVGFDYSATVVRVNEEAARAGIRIGDRADLARAGIDLRQSVVMGYAVAPGLHYDLPLIRGTRHFTAPIVTTPESGDRLAMVWLRLAVQILVTGMATLLVLRRPNPATWGLFFVMLAGCSPTNDTYLLGPVPWRVFAWNVFWFFNAAVTFGALFFALHLLHPGPLPLWRRRLETAAIVLSAAAFANALVLANSTLFANSPNVVSWIIYAISAPLPFYLAPAVIVATYFESTPQVRQRLRWIIAGFLFAALCDTADTLGSQGNLGVYQTTYVQHSLLVVGEYAGIMLPVAYAILKHHIIDVNVAISRATVYTALSVFIVGTFALVDMLFSHLLAENRAGLIADVVLALFLGFTFNSIHHHVDDFVDRLLFRKKHQAEAYVAGLAPAMAYAHTPSHVCSLLLDEPKTAFGLSGAALLDCRDGCPERIDVFASYLEGRRGSIRLASTAWNITEFLDGTWTPTLAIPLYSHSTVTGIAVYGLHRDMTDIDAEEAALLERAVEAAGSAFDRLEADAMRVEIAQLRSQLTPVS
ncbi:MAG TPA: hypothetical protein VFL13_10335 [Candidatus Baltobacteraceae bacterium]|nr:hypothetical protein [Candidatus Baltobacteraceae bacterium]